VRKPLTPFVSFFAKCIKSVTANSDRFTCTYAVTKSGSSFDRNVTCYVQLAISTTKQQLLSTYVDPARVDLVLQLISTAADALVHHLLWTLTATVYREARHTNQAGVYMHNHGAALCTGLRAPYD